MLRSKSLKYKTKRHLPLPSGIYTVGSCDIMTSYSKYGVFLRLYYPCQEKRICQKKGILDRYLQWPLWIPHKQYINGYSVRLGLSPGVYRVIQKILVGDLHIPVVWQADLKETDVKYPVIVFSHGLSGWRTTYSSICMELASRGFVVAALEHRDHSASASFYNKSMRMSARGSHPAASLVDLDVITKSPDRKFDMVTKFGTEQEEPNTSPFPTTKEWILYQNPVKHAELELRSSQLKFRMKECCEAVNLLEDLNLGRPVLNTLDVNFSTQMFKDRLDMSKCFFIGHSFGGATGILTLSSEPRFRAGILLDPWMFPFTEDQSTFSKVSQPFLCVLVQSFQDEKSMRLLKHFHEFNKDAQFVTLKKAQHRDLSDVPFIPKFSFSLSTLLGLAIDRFDALDLTIELILGFLAKYIDVCLQPASSQLENLKQRYLAEEDFTSVLEA